MLWWAGWGDNQGMGESRDGTYLVMRLPGHKASQVYTDECCLARVSASVYKYIFQFHPNIR